MQTNHFNGLSEGEAERLAVLAEECNEVSLACMKALRHGYESDNPTIDSGETNRQMIERELGHIFCIASLMQEAEDLDPRESMQSKRAKKRSIGKWLHHQ